MLQSSFYLRTALHVSGITSTHPQEHKTTITTASGNHYTVLLSAAIMKDLYLNHFNWGPGVALWLRHFATRWKASGSIPGHWGYFTGRQTFPCALGSTQPLKMSKDGRWVRVTTLPPSCAEGLEILEP
jgi:hypothetical protein